MLYELSHLIKDKLGFLWEVIEYVNSVCFVLQHKKVLKSISKILDTHNHILILSGKNITISEVTEKDISSLEAFFSNQPKDAFEFFTPHSFDRKNIAKIDTSQILSNVCD